jgi:hypothetical protein
VDGTGSRYEIYPDGKKSTVVIEPKLGYYFHKSLPNQFITHFHVSFLWVYFIFILPSKLVISSFEVFPTAVLYTSHPF